MSIFSAIIYAFVVAKLVLTLGFSSGLERQTKGMILMMQFACNAPVIFCQEEKETACKIEQGKMLLESRCTRFSAARKRAKAVLIT
jgi:hypothetical protein